MARVQREYWQRRNRFKALKWWADYAVTMILAFIAGLVWLTMFEAMGVIP